MLAFAKDITDREYAHPEEKNDAKFKEYMERHRQLNHELLIYHALDHAKTGLVKAGDDCGGVKEKLQAYLEKNFPTAFHLGSADILLLMLRKLINGHNSTNNWYRCNAYYFALIYDCLERFVKIYNQLTREAPEKAKEHNLLAAEGEIDFDDWVQIYFPDVDFLIGRGMAYPHRLFAQRNKVIEKAWDREKSFGKTAEDALLAIKDEFGLDPAAVKVILRKPAAEKDLEVFYTSVENPIYEVLYESEVGDGETLLDQQYYSCYQLRNLTGEEMENLLGRLGNTSKIN